MSINIQELLEKAIYEATEHQDDAYFITLRHAVEDQRWLQLTGDSVNACYPYGQHPEAQLRELGLPELPGCTVREWEADLYITLGFDAREAAGIAAFIEAYLKKVMSYVPGDEQWIVSYE